MKSFFRPSTFKIAVTFILIMYLVVGILFLTSYNTARSKGHRDLNTFETLGILLAYPSVFLILPGFYISENIFITKRTTTLNNEMQKDGCTNCTDERFNEPLLQRIPTPLSFTTAILFEIFFLYLLACFISTFRDFKRNRA